MSNIFLYFSAEVAKLLKRNCYALIFGFNKFIAYVLIIIFTVIVVEDKLFSFDICQQVRRLILIFILYNHKVLSVRLLIKNTIQYRYLYWLYSIV